jgi:hypothetical protein
MNILFISDVDLNGDDGNDDDGANDRNRLSLEAFLAEENNRQLSTEQIQECERRFYVYLEQKHNRLSYNHEDAQYVQEVLIRNGRYFRERIFE